MEICLSRSLPLPVFDEGGEKLQRVYRFPSRPLGASQRGVVLARSWSTDAERARRDVNEPILSEEEKEKKLVFHGMRTRSNGRHFSEPDLFLDTHIQQRFLQPLKEDEGEEQLPGKDETLSVNLNSSSATWLLNVLAFLYAATAVVVKLMEDEGANSVRGETGVVTDIMLTTPLEFFLRFATATFALSAAVGIRYFVGTRQKQKVSSGAMAVLEPQDSRGTAKVSSREEKGTTEQALIVQQEKEAAGKGSAASPSVMMMVAGAELGFWMFVTYAGQAVGMESASADHAALLLTVSVVLVPLLEAAAGHVAGRSVWVATVLTCAGMMFLEGGAELSSSTASCPAELLTAATAAAVSAAGDAVMQQQPAWMSVSMPALPQGHLWCLLGAVGSAIHVVRTEMLCLKFDPLLLVLLQVGTTATIGGLWLFASIVTGSHSFNDGFRQLDAAVAVVPWALILFAGPIGTALCEWLEMEALKHVKASTATLILTAAPLWAALLAFLLLGEILDKESAMGAALLLSGSMLVQMETTQKESSIQRHGTQLDHLPASTFDTKIIGMDGCEAAEAKSHLSFQVLVGESIDKFRAVESVLRQTVRHAVGSRKDAWQGMLLRHVRVRHQEKRRKDSRKL